MTVAEYRSLVADLVAAARRRDAAAAAAGQSYMDGRAAVERDVAAAAEAVEAASAAVATRELALVKVDQQAERVWGDLRLLRGRRVGDLPAPAFSTHGDADAAELLQSAANRIVRAKRGDSIPGGVLVVLPLLGGVCATIVALVASGLFWLGLPLAWLFFILAPFAGLPLASRWVDHREGTRLDTGAVGLTVLGGMLAALGSALYLR
ncbi:hypothetical protein F4553_005490 [Allocatelliglobosispora scoriae]|uniref:Uncharacterized protein n=1 Tax=Allocatelliglobosispora scoriae TaxID=643052 RepID=A0A841BX14_9ACTN|nr:hypothetical protein [Allocatelliglobosispora scoriae]MBB5872056.1 hypothetical protein [Allocatelliglobosispora scoriae]